MASYGSLRSPSTRAAHAASPRHGRHSDASSLLLDHQIEETAGRPDGDGDDEGTATMLSSIANMANTILGTGMLATPGAIATTGLSLGVVIVAFCGLTAAFGLYLLTRCAARLGGRKASFDAIARVSKPAYAKLFSAVVAIKCWGVSISYLIICGQLMPQVLLSFAKALGHHEPPSILLNRSFWIVLFMFFLDSLRHTSYLALLAVVYLLVIVIYHFVSPQARSQLPPRGEVVLAPMVHRDTIASVPVFVFAYTCAQNIFPVWNELKSNNHRRVNTVIGFSIGGAAVVYEIIGVLGYLTFGSLVGSNIAAKYPSANLFVSFGRLAIVILVLFSYPLQVHPCRASLDKVLIRSRAAAAVKSDYPGSEEDVEDEEDGEEEQGADPTIIAVGRRRRARVNERYSHHRHHHHEEIGLVRWCVLTTAVLLSTFFVSMFVYELDTVLGFVGAVGSTTISFILPGLLYSSLHATDTHNRLVGPARAFAVYGVLTMIISLAANVLKVVCPRILKELEREATEDIDERPKLADDDKTRHNETYLMPR